MQFFGLCRCRHCCKGKRKRTMLKELAARCGSGLPLALLGSDVSEPEVTYKSRPDCRCE